MQRNDILWKGLIEDIFPHFIPFFLPDHAHLFDPAKPAEFLDKELQQLYPQESDMQHPKFVDKLVKVFTVDGGEQWTLIHIEVQGYQAAGFARRMFTYFNRILDRYGVSVTAIAILTDDNAAFLPTQYVYDFAGTQIVYRFNTYKVLQQDEQALKNNNNPFAVAVLTVLLALKKKSLPDHDLLTLKVALYRQLRSKEFSESVARHLFAFLQLYVHFDKPEMSRKFEEEINLITGKHEPMGIKEIAIELATNWGLEKGEERGIEKGEKWGIEKGEKRGIEKGEKRGLEKGIEKGAEQRNTIFVTNLLQATNFPDEKIAALADVSVAFVQQIRQGTGK